MKHCSVLLFFLQIFFSVTINAQEGRLADTTRLVELGEVTLTTKRQSIKEQLLYFFRANQTFTLEEIIARLPAISLTRRGPYGMEPSIRAFSSGQINLLVDGMKIHGACTDKMDPATIYIEPTNLSSLIVNQTAQGILQGSTIGGTLNMQLQEPRFGSLRATTGAVTTGFQSAAQSLFESFKINHYTGKWAFLTTGTYRKAQAYKSANKKIVPYSQYSKINYSLAALHRITEKLSLKINLLADDGWNIGYPSLPMDVGYAAARIASADLLYSAPEKKWNNLRFKVYTNEVRHYMDDTQRPNVPIHMDMPGKSATSGLYAEANVSGNKKKSFRLRLDASKTNLYASMTMYQQGQLPMYMLTWPNNANQQIGLSGSLHYLIDSNTQITFSSRVDVAGYRLTTASARDHMAILQFEDKGRSFFLKNISTQLTKNLSASMRSSLSISYAERVPTSSELFGFYLFNAADGFDHMGNPKLQKEAAYQAEWVTQYTRSKWRLQTTVFAVSLRSTILPTIVNSFSAMTIGSFGVKQYNNLGRSIKAGIESILTVNPFKNISLVNTLKSWRGTHHSGVPLPLISPLQYTTALKGFFGRHHLQVESFISATQNRVNIAAGEDKTPSYFLLHLRYQQTALVNKTILNFQAGVENLFDVSYHDHLDWLNIPRPGRNFYLLLEVRF